MDIYLFAIDGRITSLYFDQNVLPSQMAVIIDCLIPTVYRILRLFDGTG